MKTYLTDEDWLALIREIDPNITEPEARGLDALLTVDAFLDALIARLPTRH